MVQLVQHKGGHVVATVGSDEKATFVKSLGAKWVINYNTEDFVEKALEYTNGEGVNVALDSVGGATFAKSIAAVKNHGTAVTYGSTAGPIDPVRIHTNKYTIQ